MKAPDISVGRVYQGKGGQVRRVVAQGPQYVFYPGQKDTDCVQYRVLGSGVTGSMTRRSFATWAQKDVTMVDEDALPDTPSKPLWRSLLWASLTVMMVLIAATASTC